MSTSLTTGEKREHDQLVERIRGGVTAFVDVGQALIRVRDARLWTDYPTFEDWCKAHFGFSKPRAYQFIESAQVIEVVSSLPCEAGQDESTNGRREQPILPNNERQVRELAKLDTPQKQADAWAKVVRTAPRDDEGNPKITAKLVADVVKQAAPQANGKPKPAPEKKPEPADEGGAEPVEAIKPLDKMDALLTKIIEQQSAVERIVGKDDALVTQIHAGLDSAYRGLTKLRAKLRKAG